jgi:lysophospholipase L1-like esterase
MTNPAEVERLVRYCHPEKLLAATTRLPGTLDDAARASLYGIGAPEYRALAARLRDEARRAAIEVRAGVGDHLAALREAAGTRVVALGDSQTDDLGSWAEILRHRCKRVLWIAPPPVDEARMLADPILADADLLWRADDVDQKAELVGNAWPDAVDLRPLAEPRHLASDGLHLSPAGQRLVVEQVAQALLDGRRQAAARAASRAAAGSSASMAATRRT